ncbi:hypothetical protein [Calothrix sp. NIES-3974]|uniref:hypothetical protein n=1 Tax=Calothrix sp. NIES-3974 TaxID=2005462 RepID=UPI000BBBE55C|nr:hypothetical protein [Calothrix sp. NIES-3974]
MVAFWMKNPISILAVEVWRATLSRDRSNLPSSKSGRSKFISKSRINIINWKLTDGGIKAIAQQYNT